MNADLPVLEILLRVLAAFVAGLIIGLEREMKGRAAGLRTTSLACVAAALAMMLSELLFAESAPAGSAWRPDPARLAAGVLTGIGFLGAGTIIRHENMIRGVTTAATLWFVTMLGLAFGAGQFLLGGLGLLLALVTLFVLPQFEKHLPADRFATLEVTLEEDALPEAQLKQAVEARGAKVKTVEFDYNLTQRQKTITCGLRLHKVTRFEVSEQLLADLRQRPGVLRVKWS
jgi:putative Mg2+ transporter-C (MgtC) family protein